MIFRLDSGVAFFEVVPLENSISVCLQPISNLDTGVLHLRLRHETTNLFELVEKLCGGPPEFTSGSPFAVTSFSRANVCGDRLERCAEVTGGPLYENFTSPGSLAGVGSFSVVISPSSARIRPPKELLERLGAIHLTAIRGRLV